jgi:hypothetical protein
MYQNYLPQIVESCVTVKVYVSPSLMSVWSSIMLVSNIILSALIN